MRLFGKQWTLAEICDLIAVAKAERLEYLTVGDVTIRPIYDPLPALDTSGEPLGVPIPQFQAPQPKAHQKIADPLADPLESELFNP